MALVDIDNRPFKRQRLEKQELKPLPTDILLLSLPHLLAHPPSHRQHTRSVFLSLSALRNYLALPNLETDLECRAWTELAEAGFRIGLDTPGIENEVEKAISKALMIAHKHPSLRIYKPQLTQLSARLAMHQQNHRLAQNSLKKIITNFVVPSDPFHIQYSAHLAYIDSLSHSPDTEGSGPFSTSNASMKSLGAIRDLQNLAIHNNHADIAHFASVLELRALVHHGIWHRIGDSLTSIEKDLEITPDISTGPKTPSSIGQPTTPDPPSAHPPTKIHQVLSIHVLIIGISYHSYAGDYDKSQSRIKKLHELLDGGALEACGISGIVEIELPNSQPLRIQVTHPRVLYTLGFLVSSISKRDPVGRKPKRRVYADEGIITVDRELKRETQLPLWASMQDLKNIQDRFMKMRVDMLCELIGVAISRSEFDDAERHLSQVIADTRNHGLFSAYSARITLHQAHLAHGLGQTERALKCYRVAAYLSRTRPQRKIESADNHSDDGDDGYEDQWVNTSARAGELWLQIGKAGELPEEETREREMEVLRKKAVDVVKQCEGLGGTLHAVGAVIAACVSKEFLVAKTHLRTALSLSTASQDNHLRALVLALIAAQYIHTSTEHAETMLSTAEQLAAGLGAQPKPANNSPNSPQDVNAKKNINITSATMACHAKLKPSTTTTGGGAGGADHIGNAHLRLWIGERALELKRRSADENGVLRQMSMNQKFEEAVTKVQKRKFNEVD